MSASATLTMKKSAMARKTPTSTSSRAGVLMPRTASAVRWRAAGAGIAGRAADCRLCHCHDANSAACETSTRVVLILVLTPPGKSDLKWRILVPMAILETSVTTQAPDTDSPAVDDRTQAAARRDELAAFLRNRRERLTPDDVGIVTSGRRRTPGLRREEVAQLAGVGVTWYTWLEQGRDIAPSPQVLDAIVRTLRLDRHERTHVFRLSERRRPDPCRRLPRAARHDPTAARPARALPRCGGERPLRRARLQPHLRRP